MNTLINCPRCKEKSVVTKLYTRKDNIKTRAIYCINKGCPYKMRLALPEEIENGKILEY